MLRARLAGLDAALDGIARGVERAAKRTVERHGERVAGAAKTEHPYTDRAGDLTASIEGLPATGAALDGAMIGGTAAGAGHASYVEEGTPRAKAYPFIEPAAVLAEPIFEQDAGALLQAEMDALK